MIWEVGSEIHQLLASIETGLMIDTCIPETWKDNPDFALYLAELSASSLDNLSK